MFVTNIVTSIIFFLTLSGLCFGSWRDCDKSDLPCIQFGSKLCVCTLFWSPTMLKRIYQYVCEDMPPSTPMWVRQTWECPIPGVGQPIGKVWRTFLDPSLEGLKKIRHQLTDLPDERTTKPRLKGITLAVRSG